MAEEAGRPAGDRRERMGFAYSSDMSPQAVERCPASAAKPPRPHRTNQHLPSLAVNTRGWTCRRRHRPDAVEQKIEQAKS
jgi:hypothetical protein